MIERAWLRVCLRVSGLARWDILGSLAVFLGFGHLAFSYSFLKHFLFGAIGNSVGLRRRLLLYVLLAGRRMHRGGHVDILSGNLRWLSIWLGSVVSLCCSASCVCSLSSLVALDAEAEHHYHSNESQDTYCHPDVLTNLTRVGLHRSVHIHSKLHRIVCVVERSDVLA